MPSTPPSHLAAPPAIEPIDAIIVKGFKSHRDELSLTIRPLTVLCGANSSGKSSIMQALLLVKQTIDDSPRSPILKLAGHHVVFAEGKELSWRQPDLCDSGRIDIGLSIGNRSTVFGLVPHDVDLKLADTVYNLVGSSHSYAINIDSFTPHPHQYMAWTDWVAGALPVQIGPLPTLAASYLIPSLVAVSVIEAFHRQPQFPGALPWTEESQDHLKAYLAVYQQAFKNAIWIWTTTNTRAIQSIIHLPGHRASSAAEFEYFPTEIGPFRPYHQLYASQLALWTQRSDERLQRVAEILADMGLASDASAVRKMGTAVRVQVGQTLGEQRTVEPLYNVGFGVSEALPIVVALVAAQPGQLVYMEQPEIHLHPRAQRALANAIVAAAQRGVRCVVETHSETMLSTFQMAIVREQTPLNRDDVIFHWFERDPVSRASKVTSVTPDEFGAYGAWPQDFGSTSAELDRDYLEAVMRRMSAPPESTPKPKSKPASARPRTTKSRTKPEQAG